MTQRVALITHGTRGIGLAIAGRLLDDGLAVCIATRKAEGLGEAAATVCHPQSLLTVAGRSHDPDHRRAEVHEREPARCQGCAPEMRRVPPGEQGAIVNISSYATVRPSPGLGTYGASNAALIHLPKQLTPEVRVNCIVLALIGTEYAGRLFEGRRDEIGAGYPLGGLGSPEDVASAVAFLSSAESASITDESLLIDGGLSLTRGVA